MNLRSLVTVVSAAVVLVSSFLLFTGSDLLGLPVMGIDTFPAGTLIAWAGLVSLPLAIYSAPGALHPPARTLDRLMAALMKTLIVLAVAWLPLSYALSGNLAFTFESDIGFQGSPSALFLFFYVTMSLVMAPILVMLLYGVLSWIGGRHRA
ncbi:MAG: hypothetical protein GVY11_05060 [Gammaproteobacteria bacterium]|jgi:hypothetical protein|nr:hypothetical protein [Gammaproteobacteria bacterium]